jgi:hypothetical protein
MFLPVVPGAWKAGQLYDDDKNLVCGSVIWNVEKVGGIEDACIYADTMGGRNISRYAWINFRDPRGHKSWPQDCRVNDLVDQESNFTVFGVYTVFFCDPSVFLAQVVPVTRSKYRTLRKLRARNPGSWKRVRNGSIPSSFRLCAGITSIGDMEGVVCNWGVEEVGMQSASIFFEKDVSNPRAIAMVTRNYSFGQVYLEEYPVDAPKWMLHAMTAGVNLDSVR